LFSNALTFVFILCIVMKVGVANIEALNQAQISGDFDLAS
jgi:hypothetical protein